MPEKGRWYKAGPEAQGQSWVQESWNDADVVGCWELIKQRWYRNCAIEVRSCNLIFAPAQPDRSYNLVWEIQPKNGVYILKKHQQHKQCKRAKQYSVPQTHYLYRNVLEWSSSKWIIAHRIEKEFFGARFFKKLLNIKIIKIFL